MALYGDGGYRWAMTERGAAHLARTAHHLAIGRSVLAESTDGAMTIEIDETCTPLPRRLRGRLLISPVHRGEFAYPIDLEGRHWWHPYAPLAHIRVELDQPRRVWSGHAYLDHNIGVEPLEARFARWTWARTVEAGRTRIFYDTRLRDGGITHQHLQFDAAGASQIASPPPMQPIGRTRWGLGLEARSKAGRMPRLLQRWEDGPFYARSRIACSLADEPVEVIHETVSLDRFRSPVVQLMLPFRMPRLARRRPRSY